MGRTRARTILHTLNQLPRKRGVYEQELQNITSALFQARSSAAISVYEHTLAWFFISTGLRPIQIARMNVRDVLIQNGPSGKEVTLHIPLAKDQGTNHGEYWLRRAPSVLADCFFEYISKSQKEDRDSLFLGKAKNLTRSLQNIFTKFETWSDRLGGPIPITPYRFRYTMATRAIAQGASDHEVARLLTHRSTNCIRYYRASMPEMQAPIANAIGKEMTYFARAFRGRLINNLSQATRKDEGEAEILDFIHLTNPTSLGACGTRSTCTQHAPISCLSCPAFEPYRDAPWEELLVSLEDDANREVEEKIRSINLNAMSAIMNIISLRDEES